MVKYKARTNDGMVDLLLKAGFMKPGLTERLLRAVDRGSYYTADFKGSPYNLCEWSYENVHLSSPLVYYYVLENLHLQPGMSFLNIGSGTGYLSTICGLVLGINGVNHGIELVPERVDFARKKLDEFYHHSSAVDEFDFCPPEFVAGNCLDVVPALRKRYDRIYCGGRPKNNYVAILKDMLKVGGICIHQLTGSRGLVRIIRKSDDEFSRKVVGVASFEPLVHPVLTRSAIQCQLPEFNPKNLTDLCRSKIRKTLRENFSFYAPINTDESQSSLLLYVPDIRREEDDDTRLEDSDGIYDLILSLSPFADVPNHVEDLDPPIHRTWLVLSKFITNPYTNEMRKAISSLSLAPALKTLLSYDRDKKCIPRKRLFHCLENTKI